MPPKKRKLSVQTSDIPRRKSLQLAVKSIKSTPKLEQIVYEKLALTLADDGHAVYIEIVKDPEISEEWEFEPTKEGCMVRNLRDQSDKQVTAVNFIKAAGEQFVKILKIPNLHLKQLFIDLESPESVCRKVEDAHKMFHPEDKEYKCTPPDCIKKLYEDNSQNLLEVLKLELKSFNFKLSVECFELEFDGFPYQVRPVLSVLQPTTLKKIVIDSDYLYFTSKLVNSEQWKKAEQLEFYGETDMTVEHWKHFKTVDIALKKITKEELDKILKTFLFLCTWERISMQFRFTLIRPAEYFQSFQVPDTTVIPGIVDNWVIEVPAMNQRVYVIYSDGILHFFRKHWVANRKKKKAVRRKFRKLEAVFSELPDVLARNVVERLDEISKRSLRQTCRVFNNIVNTTANTYEKLTLTLADNRPAIFVELFIDSENRLELEFEQDPVGYTVRNPQEGWEQTVVHNRYRGYGINPYLDFIGAAVQHFLKIFKKKTVVKKLCLVTEDPTEIRGIVSSTYDIPAELSINHCSNLRQLTIKLLDVLAKGQQSLKVQHFECHLGETCFSMITSHILYILKYMDPEFLERISINGSLSERQLLTVPQLETWRSAKEFYCSEKLPATMWSHFPKSEIRINFLSVEYIQDIYNALLVSTTWISVLITCNIDDEAEQFLERLEDQRAVESRIENSKLIRNPNFPNQFINYQLIGRKNISFTRVIQ